MHLSRREFCNASIAAGASLLPAVSLCATEQAKAEQANAEQSKTDTTESADWNLNYIVASCMYGKATLAEILPEIHKTGANTIEFWAAPHGYQLEQIDELGEEAVKTLLTEHNVEVGSFTCFKHGLFDMQGEMKLVKRLGGDMVICNSRGPKNLTGDKLKTAVKEFAEELKPHVAAAEEIGVTIGIENHGGGLISSPDSIRYLFDELKSTRIGLAMAPYHLPQDPALLGKLIEDLDTRLVHIQAWEHGMGCMMKLPKQQELMQLPHRGPLDWQPILASLKKINYQGRTEIFMHPVPRGIPILPTISEVTAEINQARSYLESLTNQLS